MSAWVFLCNGILELTFGVLTVFSPSAINPTMLESDMGVIMAYQWAIACIGFGVSSLAVYWYGDMKSMASRAIAAQMALYHSGILLLTVIQYLRGGIFCGLAFGPDTYVELALLAAFCTHTPLIYGFSSFLWRTWHDESRRATNKRS